MNALIPVAHGSESLETVTLANVLRRGGVEVTVASVEDATTVKASRGVSLVADATIGEVARREFDLIVVPGGEQGAQRLAASAPLIAMLKAQRVAHRWLGAICAAPALTLSPHGLLDGKQATCYPAFRDKLIHFVDQAVVIDGHCITSQGPGTAIEFALKLVELLAGADKRREVAQQMLVT
jgi:4-methyl-5(b-hydroxyethyl)-thiazole monophosphate biosynthesis